MIPHAPALDATETLTGYAGPMHEYTRPAQAVSTRMDRGTITKRIFVFHAIPTPGAPGLGSAVIAMARKTDETSG
jgi:hypothetical protein